MANIHRTAVVNPRAELGKQVEVGPFVTIEDDVVIGDECRLGPRVSVKNGTRLGAANEVAEGAVLGGPPQHLRAGTELGQLLIGNHNVVRENSTIHRALTAGRATRLGDHNLLMVNAHVAHDCQIGNHVVIVNNSLLGGHVEVGDGAYLGGASAIHQFCRIGRLAMLGGQSHVTQDIPPFVMVDGKTNSIVGLNLIGLRRAGLSATQITPLKQAYRIIFRSGMKWSEVLKELQHEFAAGPAAELAPFLAAGQRGFVRERRTPRAATVAFSSPRNAADNETDEAARKAG